MPIDSTDNDAVDRSTGLVLAPERRDHMLAHGSRDRNSHSPVSHMERQRTRPMSKIPDRSRQAGGVSVDCVS